MKRYSSLAAIGLGALLTIASASSVASACSRTIYASNQDGDHIHCTSTGSDANYCYYNCECHNMRGGGDCEDIYSSMGLEAY